MGVVPERAKRVSRVDFVYFPIGTRALGEPKKVFQPNYFNSR